MAASDGRHLFVALRALVLERSIEQPLRRVPRTQPVKRPSAVTLTNERHPVVTERGSI